LVSGGSNASAPLMSISSSGRFPLDISSNDSGSNAHYLRFFRDSSSPAANDSLGSLGFEGRNDAAARVGYAYINATLVDPTASSKDAALGLVTVVNNVEVEQLSIRNGNVGISRTNPQTTLDIGGSAYAANTVTCSNGLQCTGTTATGTGTGTGTSTGTGTGVRPLSPTTANFSPVYGTTSGTVMQGNDSRVTGAVQKNSVTCSGANTINATDGQITSCSTTSYLSGNSVSCTGKTKVNATNGQITSCTDATANDVGAVPNTMLSTSPGAGYVSVADTTGYLGGWIKTTTTWPTSVMNTVTANTWYTVGSYGPTDATATSHRYLIQYSATGYGSVTGQCSTSLWLNGNQLQGTAAAVAYNSAWWNTSGIASALITNSDLVYLKVMAVTEGEVCYVYGADPGFPTTSIVMMRVAD
jgi:hypothetical protein